MIHIKLFIARFIVFSLGAILLLCDKTYEFTYNNHDYIAFQRCGLIVGVVENPECKTCLSKFD